MIQTWHTMCTCRQRMKVIQEEAKCFTISRHIKFSHKSPQNILPFTVLSYKISSPCEEDCERLYELNIVIIFPRVILSRGEVWKFSSNNERKSSSDLRLQQSRHENLVLVGWQSLRQSWLAQIHDFAPFIAVLCFSSMKKTFFNYKTVLRTGAIKYQRFPPPGYRYRVKFVS